jgi:hypothetical protein
VENTTIDNTAPATGTDLIVNVAPFEKVLDAAGKLGTAEGKGAVSRPELAKLVAQGVIEGAIDPDPKKSKDVPDIWRRFQERRARAKGLVRDVEDQKSVEQQVSKLRAIAKAANRCDRFVSVLDHVIDVSNVNPTAGKATFENMVTVARVQDKDKGAEPMSREEVEKALTEGKEKEEKTEKGMLEAVLKTLNKINKGAEPNDKNPEGRPAFPSKELSIAIRALEKRVETLGLIERVHAYVEASGQPLTAEQAAFLATFQ